MGGGGRRPKEEHADVVSMRRKITREKTGAPGKGIFRQDRGKVHIKRIPQKGACSLASAKSEGDLNREGEAKIPLGHPPQRASTGRKQGEPPRGIHPI